MYSKFQQPIQCPSYTNTTIKQGNDKMDQNQKTWHNAIPKLIQCCGKKQTKWTKDTQVHSLPFLTITDARYAVVKVVTK